MGLMLDLQPSLGPALVVGGGRVALRKVRALSAAGFRTTVIAPEVLAAIPGLPGVTVERRRWQAGESVAGFALAFACTDDRVANQAVGVAARAAGIPVVVGDSQSESTAFSPAVHRDGAVQVGVSTGGVSPVAAAALRDRIAAVFDELIDNADPAADREKAGR